MEDQKRAQNSLPSQLDWVVRIAGAVCLLSYVCVYFLSQRFGEKTELIDRPIPLTLGCFIVAFLAYVFAVSRLQKAEGGRSRIVELFLWGLAFRAIVLPSVPILEVDIYRYIWDGAVSEAGVDPFQFSPESVIEVAKAATPLEDVSDAQMRVLVKAIREREGLSAVADKVHFGFLTTPYPPVSQAVFQFAQKIAGPDASKSRYLFVYKAVIVLFDAAIALTLIALLLQVGMKPELFIAWWWCPLVIKEFANSGHLDSIAVFLIVLSALLLVISLKRTATQQADTGRTPRQFAFAVGACVALALAVGAKLFPIVLAPIWAACLFRRWGWKGVILTVVFCSSTIGVCWPMVARTKLFQQQVASEEVAADTDESGLAADTLETFPSDEAAEEEEVDPGSGIEAFYRYWEMNDLIFLVFVENLKPNEMVNNSPGWFVFTSNQWRINTCDTGARLLGISPKSVRFKEVPFQITRILFAVSYIAVVLMLCWWILRRPESELGVLHAGFLALAWLWFLGPVQNPWYWTWALPFLPFVKNKWWLAVSGLTFAYYLRFWIDSHFADKAVMGTKYVGTLFFDYVVPWVEFGPFLLVLAISSFVAYRRGKHA